MHGFRPGHEPKRVAMETVRAVLGPVANYPPGIVGMVTSERTGFYHNSRCLAWLQKPLGSDFILCEMGAATVAAGRNNVVAEALRVSAAWLWFMDDDHVFAPDTLLRLLARLKDAALVQPLVVSRRSPHHAIVFEDVPVEPTMSDAELVASYLAHSRFAALAPHQRGLVDVGHCGTGGLLVDAKVFKALDPPWFEFGKFHHASNVGVAGRSVGEDTWFCLRARRAGFRCCVDLDTPMGHLTTAALWPAPVNALGDVKMEVEWDSEAATLRQRIELHSRY